MSSSPSSRSQSDGELFPSKKHEPPESYLIAHVDGGSRGNPGPAGYGVVITDQDRQKVAALSEYLGHQTNNYAEYQGLLAALKYALAHGRKALKVIGDSELLVKQIRGEYKVKSPTLGELYQQARGMIRQLDWFSIQHVLRERNHEADRLANLAMDRGMGRGTRTQAGEERASAHVSGESGTPAGQEFEGVVRDGVVIVENGRLPEGTRVQIRVRR
jgi:ribonuclease HI